MDSTIKTKVVGVTYRNEDGTRRQEIISELMSGTSLKLVDMATDEYPEAIGVFDLADQQCGFLNKSLAADIRKLGKDFEDFDVEVIEITGGDGQSYGCNIEITTDNSFTCKVIVSDHGRIKIETPLIDSDDDADDLTALYHQHRRSLSLYRELYLASDTPTSPIRVMNLSDECCGYLPPFACQEIRKRESTLDDYIVHVLEVKPDADTPYCKVFVEPGTSAPARKREEAAAKAKQEALRTAEEEAKLRTEAESKERERTIPDVQNTATAASTPPTRSKSTGCLTSIIVAITAISLLAFFLS